MHAVHLKRAFALVLALLPVCGAFAQTNASAGDDADATADLIDSVQQWARENLDDDVLKALPQLDQDRVREFFNSVQRQFQGTNLYRLAPLKESATQMLPLLHQFEETEPFAVWLQTRLDYLDAARELQKQVTVTPANPNPSPQIERAFWTKSLAKRPLPPFAKDYVPKLKPVFTAAGVPAELVWLAEVESSFNPKARSPAGAAGLFQLMPDTARGHGLSASWYHDERYNPEKSARAAANQLRSLHARYGDWRLALAAYNAGPARVDKLLKQSKTRGFDAIASRLPVETQLYVPKVEATLHKREGIRLGDLKLPKA